MLGDDGILRCDELAAQPCTGADNCVMVSDCEDDDEGLLGDAKMMGGDGMLGG